MLEKNLPGFRQRNSVFRAIKKRHSELLFERFDLKGDRRLCEVEGFGSLAEIQIIGDCAEDLESEILHFGSSKEKQALRHRKACYCLGSVCEVEKNSLSTRSRTQLSGVVHLVLMYLVFLFHSRPPDKVQAVWREQERCARLVIRNLLKNVLHVAHGIGVEWIREIDDLIVWIACSRLRSISDYESIVTQTLGRALEFQPWNHLEGRDFYFVQIQHCLILTVSEPNQLCVVSQGGDKVERAGGVNLHRSLFFDMGWVGHVKEEKAEEHTSELQSPDHLVCRLLLEKKNPRRPTATPAIPSSRRP